MIGGGRMVFRTQIDRPYSKVASLFREHFQTEGTMVEDRDERKRTIIRCDASSGISFELRRDGRVPVLSGFLSPISEEATPANLNNRVKIFLRGL